MVLAETVGEGVVTVEDDLPAECERAWGGLGLSSKGNTPPAVLDPEAASRVVQLPTLVGRMLAVAATEERVGGDGGAARWDSETLRWPRG